MAINLPDFLINLVLAPAVNSASAKIAIAEFCGDLASSAPCFPAFWKPFERDAIEEESPAAKIEMGTVEPAAEAVPSPTPAAVETTEEAPAEETSFFSFKS